MPNKHFLFIFFALIFLSCQKWDFDRARFLEVLTIGATPEFTSATIAGQIVGLRSGVVEEYGFVYSETEGDPRIGDPEVSQVKVGDTIDIEVFFTANLSTLRINTAYIFRAYIFFQGEALYGKVDTFQTRQVSLNIVQTECISQDEIAFTTEISGLGGAIEASEFGYVWSNSNEMPDLDGDKKITATNIANGRYSTSLSTTENRLYFIRPYFIPEGLEPIYGDNSFPFSTTAGGDWIRRADFPGEGRRPGVSFSIGNKGYFGFSEECGSALDDFWEFDPRSGWSLIPNIGISFRNRSLEGGFSVAGKGYAGFGCNCDNIFNDFFEFDPETKGWSRLANFPFGLLEFPLFFAIGNKGYIGGGQLFPSNCNENCIASNNCAQPERSEQYFQFDPATTSVWSTQASWDQQNLFGGGFASSIAFSIGNKAYLGFDFQNPDSEKDFWEFDPQTGWRKVASFPGRPRSAAAAFVIRDKAYVGLGGIPIALNDFYEFDPESMDVPWRKVADFPGTARKSAVSFSTNGRGYAGLGYIFAGGDNDIFEIDLWEYIPELCVE